MDNLEVCEPTIIDRIRWKLQGIKCRINSAVASLGMALIRSTVDSNIVKHAREEFKVLGWPGDCEMQAEMCKCVEDLLYVFASQGHSGFSAGYAINLFQKLADFKPISPLTGADFEWVEIGDGEYQNRRCSRVFKKNGQAYDIEGKVFEDECGGYISQDSRVPVTFPYTPHTEYVKVTK